MVGPDTRPLISVCIPAYNRAAVLPELLESILVQDFSDYEVLLAEDGSPERADIAAVIARYINRFSGRLRHTENACNLGYDGNLRNLIECARGHYCLFMGNDDLLAPGALVSVARAVGGHPDVGVVLRTYASFDTDPARPVQTFRYFDEELFFPAGAPTITTFFRRCVVISGLVIHRDAAHACATDRFDGTLLYQLYLVGRILARKNGVSLPQVLALYRLGGIPDFGNSASEQGLFVPRQQTPESSIAFMQGMLAIARDTEDSTGERVSCGIFRDLGNYSYPILAIQARQPLTRFLRYCLGLARLGFWRSALFHAYMWSLLLLGPRRVDRLIVAIKKRLGRTPALGRVYHGKSV